MSRLWRVFDGTGASAGIGVAFWLVGVAMLASILLSPDGWGWWLDAHSVQGREMDGLVYYAVNGVSYTLNDPESFPGARPRVRTVYYLPSQPSDGSLSNTTNEVMDWSLTVGPGLVGAALLARGFVKRARRNRLAGGRELPESFGDGIPSETIRAIIDRDRRTRT